MASGRQKSKQIAVWVNPIFRAAVMDKAQREAVNLSALIRGFLSAWLRGETPAEEREGEESPAPQEGEQ